MKKAAKIILDAYRIFISPVFSGLGCGCRFHPTCSNYAAEAIDKHALPKAAALIFWRILRCGPWSEGGPDPVISKVRLRD